MFMSMFPHMEYIKNEQFRQSMSILEPQTEGYAENPDAFQRVPREARAAAVSAAQMIMRSGTSGTMTKSALTRRQDRFQPALLPAGSGVRAR
jgi:hypothetical protein